MAKDLKNILLSTIEENKIKEKTPDKLPLNPTAEGWSGQEVRRFLAKSLIDKEGSFLAEFKKKMIEIKTQFEDVFGDGDGDIQGQIDDILINIETVEETASSLATTVLNNHNNLNAIKVNKTLTILGIDLQDNITLSEFKNALGDATTFANGLMSALDKQNLEQTMIDIQSLFSDKADKTALAVTDQNVVDLQNDKVNKTQNIMGLDFQDNITRTEVVNALGEATQIISGLMSITDKQRLDALHAMLGVTPDADNVVNTINEIMEIFATYPEGADILTAFNGKVDKIAGKQLSTNDLTDLLKDHYDTAYAHSQIIGSNPHKTTYAQLLNKPTTIEQAGILNVYNKEYIDTLKDKNGWESELLGTLSNNETIALSIINQYDEIQMYAKDTLGAIDNENIRPSLMQSGDKVYFFDDTQAFITVDTAFGFYAPIGYTLQVVGLKYTELVADDVRFDGSGTNYLVDKTEVEGAVKELDARVKTNADNVALKVNTSDIVDDLVSTDTDKPLSANQGKVLNDTKVDISKQVPKTPDMIGRVGIDNDGTLWYAPYIDDIIKVRGMDSLDSMVSYEGTLQPNLTHADNGDIRVYSNTFDHVFPFNEMIESTDEFGNKFVDVTVIYWKFYHDSLGNLTGYDISNKKIDDTFDIFPVHAKGKLSIGKYQAYSQGGKLYSISAVEPSMSKNIASFRTEAKAVGDDYFSNDWQSWNILQLLLTAYFGTKNTDLYFPDVNDEKSNTGTMDGYKTAVDLTTGKNVFFGIENIVKNGCHFIDGVINNNEEVWFANDHTKYSNTITSDYVLKGTKPTQDGYIKNYGGGLGLFPTENTGASSTIYYCDYLYYNPDLRVLLSGSVWGAYADLGVWFWDAHYAFSLAYSLFGSRLIKTS